MEDKELILAEIETKNGIALKQIVISNFKGNCYLQFREKWRKTDQDEWKFGKKVVSFAERQFDDMAKQMKDNGFDIAKICELFNTFSGE